MNHHHLEEILYRLDQLERQSRGSGREHGRRECSCRDRERHEDERGRGRREQREGGDGGFDEKRVVDLIVALVSQHVDLLVRQALSEVQLCSCSCCCNEEESSEAEEPEDDEAEEAQNEA